MLLDELLKVKLVYLVPREEMPITIFFPVEMNKHTLSR